MTEVSQIHYEHGETGTDHSLLPPELWGIRKPANIEVQNKQQLFLSLEVVG